MTVRLLARWAFICVALQVILLGSLNTYLLADTTEIRSKRSAVDIGAGPSSAGRATEIRTLQTYLPKGASFVGISHDYRYVAYGVARGGVMRLEVSEIGAEEAKVRTVALPAEGELQFVRWLPDRHRLFYIVGLAHGLSGGFELQLWYYDFSLAKAGLVKAIEGLPAGAKPRLMTMSTFTNLLYMTVDVAEGDSSLYRIDIMGDCSKLRLRRRTITGLQVLPKSDVVYLEEGGTGKVLVLLRGSILEFREEAGAVLTGHILGCGPDEEILVGGYSEGEAMVNRIVYGDAEGTVIGRVILAAQVRADSIVTSSAGEILRVSDDGAGTVTVRTQQKARLWTLEGELLSADRDNVAYLPRSQGSASRSGGNLLTVKSRVLVSRGS